jgi:hypothetical protein
VVLDGLDGTPGVPARDLIYGAALGVWKFLQIRTEHRSYLSGHTSKDIMEHVSYCNFRHMRICVDCVLMN